MGELTGIEWTDSTFNPWIGCQNVSPGCEHCYAETMMDHRYGKVKWGPLGERIRTSGRNWQYPVKWQRDAETFQRRHGRRLRVFCASLADVFDNQAPVGARDDLWKLIRDCPDLDWQLLSKRPQNMRKMLPKDWEWGYPNVWLGITTENDKYYRLRWPIVAKIPAVLRFISFEPAIGPLLDLDLGYDNLPLPGWVICGGESGPEARTMKVQWARDCRDECQRRDVPFFFKQWGTYESNPIGKDRDPPSNGKGGGLLDGRLWREFPR
jgi:protein gp37